MKIKIYNKSDRDSATCVVLRLPSIKFNKKEFCEFSDEYNAVFDFDFPTRFSLVKDVSYNRELSVSLTILGFGLEFYVSR